MFSKRLGYSSTGPTRGFENLMKSSFHDPAIFQHVRDPRGTAQIILENINLSIAVAHQVSAGDVAPHPLRRIEPDAGFPEGAGGADQRLRQDFVFEDFLFVINVVDKKIQRIDALLEPFFDSSPIPRRR